jgi:hypothetical protein
MECQLHGVPWNHAIHSNWQYFIHLAENILQCSEKISEYFTDVEKGKKYCHVSGVCVTNKTGFGFDVRIYWTFTQLVTTVHTWHTVTFFRPDSTRELFWLSTELNCQLLLTSYYIASGRTTVQKTHSFPSIGYMRNRIETTSCNTGCCCVRFLETGLLYCHALCPYGINRTSFTSDTNLSRVLVSVTGNKHNSLEDVGFIGRHLYNYN